MNPTKQSAGRKGGSKCGPTKARHLSPDKAKAMAWCRWHKDKGFISAPSIEELTKQPEPKQWHSQ